MEDLLELDTNKPILHITEELVLCCEKSIQHICNHYRTGKYHHDKAIKEIAKKFNLSFNTVEEIYTLVRYFEIQPN